MIVQELCLHGARLATELRRDEAAQVIQLHMVYASEPPSAHDEEPSPSPARDLRS
jgi:hypothetical protein